MTDIECIEYAVQVVLLKCRKANPSYMQVPPAGSTVMEWFADALREAKQVRGPDINAGQKHGEFEMAQRSEHILRASKQDPVLIQGVWLDAHSGRIKVRVEVGGQWLNVLNLPNVGHAHISHIVEPDGIRKSPPSNI